MWHSALEVLAILRSAEEASRLSLSDDAYDQQSDQGESVSGRSSSAWVRVRVRLWLREQPFARNLARIAR